MTDRHCLAHQGTGRQLFAWGWGRSGARLCQTSEGSSLKTQDDTKTCPRPLVFGCAVQSREQSKQTQRNELVTLHGPSACHIWSGGFVASDPSARMCRYKIWRARHTNVCLPTFRLAGVIDHHEAGIQGYFESLLAGRHVPLCKQAPAIGPSRHLQQGRIEPPKQRISEVLNNPAGAQQTAAR